MSENITHTGVVDDCLRLQQGEALPSSPVGSAIAGGGASHYAQALTLGLGYLQAASDFFSSDMPLPTLKERLDIGKPGRDGDPV